MSLVTELVEEDYLVVVAYRVKATSRQGAILKKVVPGVDAVIYGARAFEISEMMHNQLRSLGITRDSEPLSIDEELRKISPSPLVKQ